MAIRVIVVERDWQERVASTWQRLQQQAATASPFQSWEWASLWWKYLGKGKRAQIVCLQEGEDTVGIAPLYAQMTPTGEVYRWIGTGISDRLGILALPSCERAVAEAVVEWLSTRPRVDLQQLPEGSYALRAAQAAGWEAMVQETCPFVVLPETWETYWESLSKKMRFNLGYAQRQLQRSWNHWQIHLAHSAEIEGAMHALFDLHTRRWRKRAMPGGFFRKTVRQFHLEWARQAWQNGWLRLYVLQLEHRIGAVMYVFHWGRRAYYYLSGFEPRLARYSLGTVLTAHAIRQAIEEGCVLFDFLRGDEPYKHRWNPQLLYHWRAYTARGAGGKLWQWRIACETRLWRSLQAWLHRR